VAGAGEDGRYPADRGDADGGQGDRGRVQPAPALLALGHGLRDPARPAGLLGAGPPGRTALAGRRASGLWLCLSRGLRGGLVPAVHVHQCRTPGWMRCRETISGCSAAVLAFWAGELPDAAIPAANSATN
jgi:hypothetical protein